MSRIELRLGDVFDGPSDLIVLPCSTTGSVTQFVRQKLVHFSIPYPHDQMRLGEVRVSPFEGGESIAQFVAYAASVEASSSSSEAIYRIGVQLGEQTMKTDSIRRVAVPLLGAGAGGLASETVVSSLRDGFRSSCHKDASLVISILHQSVFDRLQFTLSDERQLKHATRDLSSPDKPPRVFISYSHTSPQHRTWVQGLGTFLRQNGVDARLDLWHLRRGMDLPQFMTNELTLADRVVIVSDERYAQKADGRVGGVGWETMIVQGDISRLPPESTKYLVIVRSTHVDDGLPVYLKTKFVIHWPVENTDVEEENRMLLLREVFDFIPVPPLGPRPLFL